MGWNPFKGWFATKRVVTFGGGVSRLRQDELIRNSSGIVVSGAIQAKEDITEALRLNAISGTVASYKQFNRRAARSTQIGLPTTTFTYSSVDKDLLAAAIRTDLGTPYPLSTDILTGDINLGSIEEEPFFHYTLQESYNYNLTSNTFIYLTSTYNLVSYSVTTILGQYQYTVNGTLAVAPFTPISFNYLVDIPEQFTTIIDDQTGDPINIPIQYWAVYYTYSGRKYIWIKENTESLAFSEQINTHTPDKYTTFAPIIPIMNNKVKLTRDSNPILYRESSKCLDLLGLTIEAITDQITEPNAEDAYVSLFSNLITTHEDQLAYNYAFFEYMDQFTINTSVSFNPLGTGVYNFNKLTVEDNGVYNHIIGWGYIDKDTGLVGTLSNDYEAELITIPGSHFFLNTTRASYLIKKKTSPNTYDQILVGALTIEYLVYASENDNGTFSVDVTNDNANQLVIPVSFAIAQDFIPRKYYETFLMRSTHVGIFAKQVTKVKWYQQEWFAVFLIIIAIVYVVYTGDFTALDKAIAITQFTLEVSFTVALLIVLFKYVVVSVVLRVVFQKLIKSGVLPKELATIAYITAAIYFGGGFDLSTSQQFMIAAKTYLEAENISLQVEAADLQKDFQEFQSLYTSVAAELELIQQQEYKQQYSAYVLDIYNMFRGPDQQLTESDIQLQAGNPDHLTTLVSSFVDNALKVDPATLIVESNILIS